MWGDTIAAIATPWGDGGVAIVRLSGPDSWRIAHARVILPCGEMTPRYAHNGQLTDEWGQTIDHVLVLPFKAPRSYTGEDVVEIHCHGGSLLAQRCLELVISAGARQALPGEFTRRAFENGRLDLSQAEAVAALIHARSNEALRAANRTLSGELTEQVKDLREGLISLAAEVEVGLDFPDEDVPLVDDGTLAERMEVLRSLLADLKDRCASGVILREGVRVALVGRPNAGKSSLLNALLKESRSIVTSVPGTTRDIVEAVLTYRGVPLRLVDTAGMGEPSHDEVELLGVERAKKAMKSADVRVWIIDGSRPADDLDMKLIADAAAGSHVLVISKSDLERKFDEKELAEQFPDSPLVVLSAKKGAGLDELKEAIVSLAYGNKSVDDSLNASVRQVGELKAASESLEDGRLALESGLGQGAVASCLADAKRALDRLLGLENDQSLLDEIFSRFCVGK